MVASARHIRHGRCPAGPTNRPVVGILGDGAFQYSVQGLYTAALYNIPATFPVLRNSQYAILKWFGEVEVPRRFRFDLPDLDAVPIAEGYGVPGRTVSDSAALADALSEALGAEGPRLIQVISTGRGRSCRPSPRGRQPGACAGTSALKVDSASCVRWARNRCGLVDRQIRHRPSHGQPDRQWRGTSGGWGVSRLAVVASCGTCTGTVANAVIFVGAFALASAGQADRRLAFGVHCDRGDSRCDVRDCKS